MRSSAINFGDAFFIFIRLVTASLCFIAAVKSWKQAHRYSGRPHRILRARIGAVLIGLIGVLCLLAGYQ